MIKNVAGSAVLYDDVEFICSSTHVCLYECVHRLYMDTTVTTSTTRVSECNATQEMEVKWKSPQSDYCTSDGGCKTESGQGCCVVLWWIQSTIKWLKLYNTYFQHALHIFILLKTEMVTLWSHTRAVFRTRKESTISRSSHTNNTYIIS